MERELHPGCPLGPFVTVRHACGHDSVWYIVGADRDERAAELAKQVCWLCEPCPFCGQSPCICEEEGTDNEE